MAADEWHGSTSLPNSLYFDPTLSGPACKLLGVLVCLSVKLGYAFATEPTLAGYLGCSLAQLKRHLNELKRAKLLRVERGGRPGISGNRYFPLVPNSSPVSQSNLPANENSSPVSQSRKGIAQNQGGERLTSEPSNSSLVSYNKGSNINTKDEDLSKARPHRKSDTITTTPLPLPQWIAGVIMDYSRELGDATHESANIIQALNLWRDSGQPEAAFVTLLHATKAAVRHRQAGGLENKMAYFFTVLRGAVAAQKDSAA